MFDRLGRGEIDVDGVDLDEASRLGGAKAARQGAGEAALGCPAAGVRAAAQARNRLDEASGGEIGEDAADLRI